MLLLLRTVCVSWSLVTLGEVHVCNTTQNRSLKRTSQSQWLDLVVHNPYQPYSTILVSPSGISNLHPRNLVFCLALFTIFSRRCFSGEWRLKSLFFILHPYWKSWLSLIFPSFLKALCTTKYGYLLMEQIKQTKQLYDRECSPMVISIVSAAHYAT